MSTLPSLLYSDTEDDLRAAVRDLLDDHAPWAQTLERTDTVPAGDNKLWPRIATELGLAGLAVAEDAGGAGATWSEAAVVLEELGRSIADAPFFTSAVLATAAAMAAGADDLMSELAAGDIVAAVVVPLATPWSRSFTNELTLDGDSLSGTAPLVAGALEADVLLVPVGDVLVRVDAANANLVEAVSLDMTRRVADVTFDKASVHVVASGEVAVNAVNQAAVVGAALLASEQLGLAERALDMTVEYVKDRRQFGRTLGSYQAIKHRLADLWTAVSQARAVARYAAACVASDDEDAKVAASVAQALCSDVAVKVTEEAVQLHGGIGFTWEHPIHLYLKRARADALALGTAAHHRAQLGALVGLPRPTTTSAS